MRSVTIAALLAAGPAFAGPDFVTGDRAQPLAASDSRHPQDPADELAFDHASSALRPVAQQQLATAAAWLERHPGYRLVIEGHADQAGSPGENQAMAARRADIARNHLIATGVAADRIVVAVYGENRAPRAPGPAPADRRVVVLASAAPVAQLVSEQLDANAIELTWTDHGSMFHESRGISPVETIVPSVTARKQTASRRGG